MTLTFIVITLFCLLCTGCVAKVLYISIQPDQWIDTLFKWQKLISYFGDRPGPLNTLLYKTLGGCSFCFSHAITFICFWGYVLVMISGHLWPIFDTVLGQWAFNVCWYMGFISFGTTLSNILIGKT